MVPLGGISTVFTFVHVTLEVEVAHSVEVVATRTESVGESVKITAGDEKIQHCCTYFVYDIPVFTEPVTAHISHGGKYRCIMQDTVAEN